MHFREFLAVTNIEYSFPLVTGFTWSISVQCPLPAAAGPIRSLVDTRGGYLATSDVWGWLRSGDRSAGVP